MKAALLVLAACAAVALADASHASALRLTCAPGGVGTRTFCGPAKATLKFGGKKYTFRRGGNCTTDESGLSVNLGTSTLVGKPKSAYLGITVFSKKPGAHDATVSWQLHGRSRSLSHGKATVVRGLKRGTFTGLLSHGRRASGSFTCK